MNSMGSINLAPSVPTLDGTHLNTLLELYIQSCRQRLDHQYTVDGYEYALKPFKDWWQVEGPRRQWQLQATDFVQFEKHLRPLKSKHTGKRISYHTRATILKRLREALNWAQNNGYLARDYAAWVPLAHGAPPKRKAVSIPSLHQLLAAAGKGLKGRPLRDRCIVAMLIGMGLRRAELSSIRIEAIIMKEDCSGHTSVVGKRTKANATGEREAAFDRMTGRCLKAYLDEEGRNSGPLFLGEKGDRLMGAGIYKVVKRAIEAAGLGDEVIGPHDLRRAFATHYARSHEGPQAADILRRQMGHANYEMTSEYTLFDVSDLERNIVSPLAEQPLDEKGQG